MLARLYRAEDKPSANDSAEPLRWTALRDPGNGGVTVTGTGGSPEADAGAICQSFQAELAEVQSELERSRRAADAKSREAYEAGLTEGRRQGLAQNQAELDSFRKQIATSLHGISQARLHAVEQADEDLVRLAVAISEKILNRQIQIDAGALQGLVSTALGKLAGKTVHCVRIHPQDRGAIQQEIDGLGPRRAIRLEDDSSLPRGALIFDTDFGTLDSSVTTQLEEIERGLVDRLRRTEG